MLLPLYLILCDINSDFLFPFNIGGIGFVQLFQILIILLIINSYKKINNIQFDSYKKVAINYIIISLLFNLYYYFKIHGVMLNDFEYSTIIIRLFKHSMLLIVFVIISNRANSYRFYNLIERYFILFGVFYSISTLLYYPLLNAGIDISFSTVAEGRNYGLFAKGDSNSLSAIFVMILGYFFAKYESGYRIRKLYVFTIVFILLGIIQTGSRGGFLSLLLMVLYFYSNNYRSKNIGKFFIMTIFIFSFIYFFGESLIDRTMMKTYEFQRSHSYDQTRFLGANIRFYKWSLYIEDLIANPKYFIAGIFETRPSWLRFQSHNVFIQLIYYGGLTFFIPYFINFINILRIKKTKNMGSYSLKYILIPYFVMLMELNTWFYFIIPFFIIHSYGYINEDRNKIS